MSPWQKFKQKMPMTKNVMKFTLYATAAVSVGLGVVIGAPLAVAGAAAGHVAGAIAGAGVGLLTTAMTGVNMLTGIVLPATLLTGIGETIYNTSKETDKTNTAGEAKEKIKTPKNTNGRSKQGPSLSLKAKGQTAEAFSASGQKNDPAQSKAAQQKTNKLATGPKRK